MTTQESQGSNDHETSLHVRRAIQNDRASVGWIVARFTPLLAFQARQRMAASLRRVCDPDDVVADVWMVVLQALPRLQPSGASFSRGLLRFSSTVMIRRLRDLLEKHVVGKPSLAPDPAMNEISAETRGVVSHVIAEEMKGRVWAALDALPEADREIVVLRGIEGRAHAEIAARVGLSPEHVAVRYHRALGRLRAHAPMSVFDDLEEG